MRLLTRLCSQKNLDITTQLIKRLNHLIKDFNEFQQAIKSMELHKRGEKTTQV